MSIEEFRKELAERSKTESYWWAKMCIDNYIVVRKVHDKFYTYIINILNMCMNKEAIISGSLEQALKGGVDWVWECKDLENPDIEIDALPSIDEGDKEIKLPEEWTKESCMPPEYQELKRWLCLPIDENIVQKALALHR